MKPRRKMLTLDEPTKVPEKRGACAPPPSTTDESQLGDSTPVTGRGSIWSRPPCKRSNAAKRPQRRKPPPIAPRRAHGPPCTFPSELSSFSRPFVRLGELGLGLIGTAEKASRRPFTKCRFERKPFQRNDLHNRSPASETAGWCMEPPSGRFFCGLFVDKRTTKKKKGSRLVDVTPYAASAQDRNRTCTGFNSH